MLKKLVPPTSWLCVTCTVTLAVPLAGWNVTPLSVERSKSTSELKYSVWVVPSDGKDSSA